MRKLLRVLFLLFVFNTPYIIIGGGETGEDATRLNNYVEYHEEITKIKSRIEEKDSIAYHTLDSIPIYCPIKVSTLKSISSDYGYRIHPIHKYPHIHKGVDFSAQSGTKVFSAGAGVVKRVEESKYGYGNQIIIAHADNYETRYAHLKDIHVEVGDQILPKQVIGTIGDTGLTTGPHLHYELLKNGYPLDPLLFTYLDKKERSHGNYFVAMIALEKY